MALLTIAAVGGLVAAGLTAASAVIYDAVAENDGISGLDRPVLGQMIAWRTSRSEHAWTLFTHLGGVAGMSILATALTLVMMWRRRSWTPLILMAVAVAGSLTFTTVGKAVVGRPRPPLNEAVPPYEYAFSFPSGHTLNSTVIAGVFAYLLLQRLRRPAARLLCIAAAAAWAAAMGFSRVLLGHHWLSDVLFAWLPGLAWLSLIVTAHRTYLALRRGRSPADGEPREHPRPRVSKPPGDRHRFLSRPVCTGAE